MTPVIVSESLQSRPLSKREVRRMTRVLGSYYEIEAAMKLRASLSGQPEFSLPAGFVSDWEKPRQIFGSVVSAGRVLNWKMERNFDLPWRHYREFALTLGEGSVVT